MADDGLLKFTFAVFILEVQEFQEIGVADFFQQAYRGFWPSMPALSQYKLPALRVWCALE
jgi:hypothetical protein